MKMRDSSDGVEATATRQCSVPPDGISPGAPCASEHVTGKVGQSGGRVSDLAPAAADRRLQLPADKSA
jgi:hypothetical protein